MPIILPNLYTTRLVGFVSCGKLVTKEPKVLNALKEYSQEALKESGQEDLVAAFGTPKSAALVRLALGGTDSKHLHIDVIRKGLFDREFGKVTHKKKDIEAILNVFEGEKITTMSMGFGIAPFDKLPEGSLIRSSFFAKRQGDLSITMSSAVFNIKGAPIQGLEWSLDEEEKKVRVQLRARVEAVLDADYLSDQLRLLDAGFRLFVLGGDSDDAD